MRVHRRLSVLAGLLAITLTLTAVAPGPIAAGETAPGLTARVIQDGLAIPWDVAFTPDRRMLVTERAGRVRVYRSAAINAELLNTTYLRATVQTGEAGMMGIAVDRQFETNRRVYVCATREYRGEEVRNQVIAYTLADNNKLRYSHFVIRDGMDWASIHNGCAVEHGPDGKVWVAMGDASQPALAQDPNSLNGKILRANPNGTVPADNPVLPGASRRTFAYSMGHRNPQGIAFQPGSGRVYAVEHGPERDDEINLIRPGANYGWPCVTGFGRTYASASYCELADVYADPAWASGSPTLATSNAAFALGSQWAGWENDLFVATLKQDDTRRFVPSTSGTVMTLAQTLFDNQYGRLRSATMGPQNQLILTTSNGTNDRVIRIKATP